MLPSFQVRCWLIVCLFGLYFGTILPKNYLWIFLFSIILSLIFQKKYFAHLLLISFSVLGFYSFHYEQKITSQTVKITKEVVKIKAKTLNYAKKNGPNQNQHLQIISLDKIKNPGKLLLQHQQDLSLSPETIIAFNGKIKAIKNYGNFNYARYLFQFGISGIVTPKEKIVIEQKPKSFIYKVGPFLRQKAQKNIESKLSPPHSLVALGMTIGINEKLPTITESQIKNSGLQHLIVVSGSNITLLVCFIVLLFRNLGPYALSGLTVISIIIFWLTVGPDPPVNRAVVFGLCSSLSLILGKTADARNLVLFAALVMSLLNPLLLSLSISFWLSFTATMGIVCLVPIFFIWLKPTIRNQKINLSLSLILSAQISVFTIIIHHFDKFPASGLISNLIVEPLVPLIMISTSLLGLVAPIPILGDLVGFVTFHLVNLVLLVANLSSPMPQMTLPKFVIYTLYALQILTLAYCLFSKHYQKNFYEPFQSKLDLSAKPKKI